ncbi:MAG: polysaccharide biosynthesis/export family protein [Bacteroidia bacterium]|nr:polysaccharide biosynthesis/export family protein [Bacteroidia bacterium]HQZ78604.1 polysaccharide biosynthesis/export family protein [Bacteroidia bacterium]
MNYFQPKDKKITLLKSLLLHSEKKHHPNKMKNIGKLLLVLVFGSLMTGCSINSSIMFKTKKDFVSQPDRTIGNVEYKIAPNDILSVSVYTNEGIKLIDLTANSNSLNDATNVNTAMNGSNQYTVDIDGFVKLPIIGKIKIQNLTTREADKLLEQQYATYYNKPFVITKVLNRRVLVFPGEGGAGRVVTLTNENTTLIEGLALAGGISQNGIAKKIKLIRGDTRNPQVTIIDLSTIEGMKESNLLLQANDIIYVEPRKRISQGILSELAPIVAIFSGIASIFIAYDVIKRNQ